MKNIFFLVIFATLCFSIKIPYTDWEWEWNWNFDWIKDIIGNLKTKIPEFITNIKEDLEKFIKDNEDKKNAILDEMSTKVQEAYENVMSNKDKYLKGFIEQVTKTAKFITYKICDAADMTSYEECRNNKKLLLSKLIEKVNNVIGYVNENFQCSKIASIITSSTISSNLEENLKYILFLVNYISNNPDAIEKGKAQAIYDVVNCLEEKFEEYWPEVKSKLTDKTYIISLKKDITNLLIQTASNLVSVIHFEELDGYIQKANNKTGLISSENAKKIHQRIFKLLKRLDEFGTSFYNFSASMLVNVTINPGDKELGADAELFISNLEEKGIRVVLHSNYLLRNYNAYSVQSVVFDSPLVSIRGRTEKEGGTANTFVGITLYDKDGKEIIVKDININDFKPIIYYKKKLFNAMTTCLFYNENEDKLENSGVDTQVETINGEEYLKCIPKHLTSFTIGSYKSASTSGEDDSLSAGIIVLIVVLCLIVLAGLVVGFIYFRRKAHRVDNSQLQQAFPNKDGLL